VAQTSLLVVCEAVIKENLFAPARSGTNKQTKNEPIIKEVYFMDSTLISLPRPEIAVLEREREKGR
jgi:hypothetical protein